jgi:hypothetical protein
VHHRLVKGFQVVEGQAVDGYDPVVHAQAGGLCRPACQYVGDVQGGFAAMVGEKVNAQLRFELPANGNHPQRAVQDDGGGEKNRQHQQHRARK